MVSRTGRALTARAIVVAGFAALAVAAIVVAVSLPRYLERARYESSHDGCRHVPMAPAVTPQTHPGSYLWPYGAVTSCRVLDGSAHLFGEVDVSYVVVLETEAGPVLARVDYDRIDAGRQVTAQAVELDPAIDGAGLSDDEVQRVVQAVAVRGGVQREPWIVNYGDG